MGGLAGKTTISTYIANQLAISRIIAIDELKNFARKGNEEKKFLFPATYESVPYYKKTVDFLLPFLIDKLKMNVKESTHYKKWSYFWEGIYLSAHTLDKVKETYPNLFSYTVFLLPPFAEIKRRYMLRWASERGEETLTTQKETFQEYVKNLKTIYELLQKESKESKITIISAVLLEDQLEQFYKGLHGYFEQLSKTVIPGWIEKVMKNSSSISEYNEYLDN
jgi:2-phosphoglycerate kinase